MSPRASTIAGWALLAGLFAGDAAAYHARPNWPDCFCTNRGERVEIGTTSCLTVNGHSFLARCYMSENTPGWRRLDQACDTLPVSSLSATAPVV